MTPQKQQLAIAEACGWILHPKHAGLDLPLELTAWVKPGLQPRMFRELPDYLNDLDACFQMEECLSNKNKLVNYQEHLCRVVSRLGEPWPQLIYHATAAQRCEAFLRTLNLWTEEETK